MPSNTGVATLKPSALAATPRCVSSTWPTFIRHGTPSGLSTMSTGVPSARNGMSSSGTMLATTPLLPWRPAILSPTESLRFAGDVDLDLLDDAGIDVVAALDAVQRALALEFELGELVFELADDLADLDADRARVDLDVIVDRRQLAQQRLGDLAVGRDDDLAGLRVDDVERDLLAQQDVARAPRSAARAARPSCACTLPRSALTAGASSRPA